MTPEYFRLEDFRCSITVLVRSSLRTRVPSPTALPPPLSAATGTKDPFHVPTRSVGRADGRTSDSVDRATPPVGGCVAHPASAINAMPATYQIPRLTMSIAPPSEAPSLAIPE